jgi:hypothetical protein
MEVDGKANYVTSQRLDILKVLPGEFRELDLPRIVGLEPAGEVDAFVEGQLCRNPG